MSIAKRTIQRGFTLVELLIVVIILGILAAIVVPQFTATTADADNAAIQSNLQNMRSAIEFYRQEHGHWPGSQDSTGATCGVGAPSGGLADTEASFISSLTEFTSASGQACTGTDGTLLGPYLPEIPPNTRIAVQANQRKVRVLAAGVLNPTPNGIEGWMFDTTTGQLLPNDN